MLSAGHVACCRPKKARQLARNCSDGYRLRLAPPEQRSVATVETALRLPGDLAHFWRRGCDLGLFGNAHPGRMLIAPGAFHQRSARPSIARFGDGAPPDAVSGRTLRTPH